MASSNQYLSPQQQQYFQSNRLPSPSELGLSYPNRGGPLSPGSTTTLRYPPSSSYNHPSLANVSSQLQSPSTAPSTQAWASRTGSSNSPSPSLRQPDLRPKAEQEDAAGSSSQVGDGQARVKHEGEDGMPATSDFVKKLYKMLEDNTFADVVCWGPQGDCFVIKDLNEFTKSILPRMFKHSNFASFVRQLNKYDFHKVKSTDETQYGEHCWIFRHPEFHVNGREALENIKRKVPGNRKQTQSSGSPPPSSSNLLEGIHLQIERMARQQEELTTHIRTLENEYDTVVNEMMTFQRNLTQQDGLMQNLIQYFVQFENAKIARAQAQGHMQGGFPTDPNPFLQADEAQHLLNGTSYPDPGLARASLMQMNEISRRAEVAGMTFSTAPGSRRLPPLTPGPTLPSMQTSAQGSDARMGNGSTMHDSVPRSKQDVLARITELTRAGSSQGPQMWLPTGAGAGSPPSSMDGSSDSSAPQPSAQGAYDSSAALASRAASYALQSQGSGALTAHDGLQVYTVGHLMPRSTLDDPNGNWSFDPNLLGETGINLGESQDERDKERQQQQQASGSASIDGDMRSGTPQTIRVRRSTYVPLWSVPPKVLIVDDDAISRKLGSKFLQVFGCTTDIAVDGVSAINKMNLEKYDLVLMDIVMPKLDGVSATSLIRQFDHMTPIISMTSNANPNQIVKFYSSGMNDFLPKPFTKDGILSVLEKHLMHLKVIKTMAQVPRSLNIPAELLGQAMSAQVKAGQSGALATADGRINPLAAMGLSDDQYNVILQNLVNGEAFEDVMVGAGPSTVDGKRPMPDSPDDRDNKRSRFEEVE